MTLLFNAITIFHTIECPKEVPLFHPFQPRHIYICGTVLLLLKSPRLSSDADLPELCKRRYSILPYSANLVIPSVCNGLTMQLWSTFSSTLTENEFFPDLNMTILAHEYVNQGLLMRLSPLGILRYADQDFAARYQALLRGNPQVGRANPDTFSAEGTRNRHHEAIPSPDNIRSGFH
jgi:hypothetical protein